MRQFGNHPLWIGTARDARDIIAVHAAGIRAIVDLAAEEPPVAPTRDLVYLRFPIVDGGGNDPKLLRCLLGALGSLIRERIPTVVACQMGLSRSPTVTAVAFGHIHGMPTVESMKFLDGPRDLSPSLMLELEAVIV